MSAGLSGVAVAVALIGALTLTPAGSLAQDFVSIFQPQQVAPVGVTAADLRSLLQLRHYGTVQPPHSIPNETANSLAGAESDARMQILAPAELPADVPSSVSYDIVHGATGSFTFSATRAQAWADQHGQTLPAMPDGIDGGTMTVTMGDTVAAIYGASDGVLPTLVIGQTPAPKIATTGVSAQTMETYILGLPGISPQLKAEIQALGDPTSTLLLPIPVDYASSHPVTVRGVKGYAIGDNTGLGSAVIWEQNGMIYGVGGTISQSEALQIAGSLR